MTADKAWNLTWQAALKLIGVMNSAIVLIRGFRQNDSAGWMSAFTVLLTIVCIWVVSARLQKEISCAVADVEGHQMLRLKSNVSYLELFANVAIVAALSFAH